MDVPLVNTFMGGDGAKNQDQNWEEALRIWPDIVRFARTRAKDHARELPNAVSATTSGRAGTTSPRPPMWRRILEQWGGTIGLNFDPSHLILQMIDVRRFLKEFGPHVLHFQAKDLMIDRDGLYGARRALDGAWAGRIPRIPGLGEVDWSRVFSELYRAGFEGDCIIEHEDRRFGGNRRQGQQGFLIARDVLRPYCR